MRDQNQHTQLSVVKPQVNRAQIAKYLELIFPHCGDGHLAIRGFYGTRGKRPPIITSVPLKAGLANLGDIIDRCEAMAMQAAQSLDPINLAPPACLFQTPVRACQANILWAPTIAVDIDEGLSGDPAAGVVAIEAVIGPATVVVASGGRTAAGHDKLHAHWRLTAPADRQAALGDLQQARALAAALGGGDRSAATPTQPLRLPGSLHTKDPANPRLCRIIRSDPAAEVDLQQALTALVTAARRASIPTCRVSHGVPDDPLDQAPYSAQDRIELAREITTVIDNNPGAPYDPSDPNDTGWTYSNWFTTFCAFKGMLGDVWDDPKAVDVVASFSAQNDGDYGEGRRKYLEDTPVPKLGYDRLRKLADAHSRYKAWIADGRPANRTLDSYPAFQSNVQKPFSTAVLPPVQMAKPPRWADAVSLAAAPPPSPQQWVLDGLIPAGELTLLTGPAGNGKSFLITEIAAHAAAGRGFGGTGVATGGTVALLAEDGDRQNHRRAKAIETAFALPMASWRGFNWLSADSVDDPALFVADRWGQRVSETALFGHFAYEVNRLRPAMVVIDNANACFLVGSNDYLVVNQCLNALQRLAKSTGAAVVLIHHPPKSEESPAAGSAAFINKPRCVLHLRKPRKDEPEANNPTRILLEVYKTNLGPGNARMAFERDSSGVLVPIGTPTVAVSPTHARYQQQVAVLDGIGALQARGQYASPSSAARDNFAGRILMTTPTVAVLGMNEKEIAATVNSLLQDGHLRVDEGRGPNRHSRRELAPTGSSPAPPALDPAAEWIPKMKDAS